MARELTLVTALYQNDDGTMHVEVFRPVGNDKWTIAAQNITPDVQAAVDQATRPVDNTPTLPFPPPPNVVTLRAGDVPFSCGRCASRYFVRSSDVYCRDCGRPARSMVPLTCHVETTPENAAEVLPSVR